MYLEGLPQSAACAVDAGAQGRERLHQRRRRLADFCIEVARGHIDAGGDLDLHRLDAVVDVQTRLHGNFRQVRERNSNVCTGAAVVHGGVRRLRHRVFEGGLGERCDGAEVEYVHFGDTPAVSACEGDCAYSADAVAADSEEVVVDSDGGSLDSQCFGDGSTNGDLAAVCRCSITRRAVVTEIDGGKRVAVEFPARGQGDLVQCRDTGRNP